MGIKNKKIRRKKVKVSDFYFYITLNNRFQEDDENYFFANINKDIYSFLEFLSGKKGIVIPYNYFKYTRKFIGEGWETEFVSRRSFTDILGMYFTYFPNVKINEKNILEFTKVFLKFLKDYDYVGHFCNTPNKIVFMKKNINYIGFKKEFLFEGIPLQKINHIDWENTEEYKKYCKLYPSLVKTGNQTIQNRLYSNFGMYAFVDPNKEKKYADLLSYDKLIKLFRLV